MIKSDFLNQYAEYHYRQLPNRKLPYEYVDIATRLILQEAGKCGISFEVIDESDVIILTKGVKKEYIRSRQPSTTSSLAEKICRNKTSTKTFLKRAGVTTTKGFTILPDDSENDILSAWNGLQKPIVFKPTHGSHGNAIVTGITNFEECKKLISNYFKLPSYTGGVLLEEMFVGNECRIIATRDKVVAAMERVPAFVTGDGVKTISELIEKENLLPIRNIAPDVYPHITVDDDLISNLQRIEMNLKSIAQDGEKITLRSVSNVMAGGIAIDRTDEIHSSVIELAIKTVRAIPGLTWAGIDFMSTDLLSQQTDDSYCIIEVGSMPEFDIHDVPMNGKPRDVAKEFLRLMFPEI